MSCLDNSLKSSSLGLGLNLGQDAPARPATWKLTPKESQHSPRKPLKKPGWVHKALQPKWIQIQVRR